MEKVGLFLTMRSTSSRLPNKSLMIINWMINRMKSINKISDIFLPILCTSYDKSDDRLAAMAEQYKIDVYRGELENKVGRWLGACKTYRLSKFINIDGDDFFFGNELMTGAAMLFDLTKADIVVAPKDIVIGGFTYGFTTDCLEKINNFAKDRGIKDTEMVSAFIDKKTMTVCELPLHPDYLKPNYRFTLDYQEDLDFMEAVMGTGFINSSVPLRSIIRFVDKNPHLLKINASRAIDWKRNQNKKIKELKV